MDATGRKATKTESTIAAYRSRLAQLQKSSGCLTLRETIAWFGSQHDRWAPATIRQYRACLIQGLVDQTNDFDEDDLLFLSTKLSEGPSPRTSGEPRTSARKRKSISFEDFAELVGYLRQSASPYDRLAAELFQYNVVLFLRPVEWKGAVLDGAYFKVRNAKNTNGRAHGPFRTRDLHAYDEDGIRHVGAFLAKLRNAATAAGSFERLFARLASRVARACADIGIARVCLYTARHVGIANAKAWMNPAQIAAAAGHCSTRTATIHYAPRRTGWGIKAAQLAPPVPSDVDRVAISHKASREANIAFYAEKRLAEQDQTHSFRL